jgi:hypothetical protein
MIPDRGQSADISAFSGKWVESVLPIDAMGEKKSFVPQLIRGYAGNRPIRRWQL